MYDWYSLFINSIMRLQGCQAGHVPGFLVVLRAALEDHSKFTGTAGGDESRALKV